MSFVAVTDPRFGTARPSRVPRSVAVPASQARICVIFASRGRPAILDEAVAALDRQTLRPSAIILSCPESSDAGIAAERQDLRLVTGARGLAAQRNAGLRHVPGDCGIVVFFDDDFLPREDWLAQVAALFARHPDIGAVTGTLVADGIKGPGLSFADARRLLAQPASVDPAALREHYVPYGCNMAFRASAIAGLSFDERLVLYGWLEDRDFGATLARQGYRIVKTGAAVGVHLGVKVGRVSGRRLGYSQMVNPLYLYHKGTMPLRAVADHLFRNFTSNLVRTPAPEPFIDRRGRLIGNLRGLRDAACGILQPERAAKL